MSEVLHAGQLDRPERHGVAGGERAMRVLAARELRGQRAAARHDVAPDEVRVRGIDAEARHQHRGHRREEVRIRGFQQVSDQARLLGLELELDASGEKREALEQALDVWVGDLHAFHAEPRSDLGELARELGADLAQMRELVAVEAQ